MERWSVHRYRLPRLNVDAIRQTGGAVEMDSARGTIVLTCEQGTPFDGQLISTLETLRDPRSELWATVRSHSLRSDLLPLLKDLDHLGLICETSRADVASVHDGMARDVNRWAVELGRELALRGDAAITATAELMERLSADPFEPLATTLSHPSFYAVTLLLQARYLRENAPTVLHAVVEALQAAVAHGRRGVRTDI